MKYNFTDNIPNFNDMVMVFVYGPNCNYVCMGDAEGETKTFEQVLKEANYDFETPTPTYIIVEAPLRGKIYLVGNYSDDKVYEHGNTHGYC